MKKRKKIVSTLLIASYVANQPINVLAQELKDINTKNIEQTEENLDVRPKSNSLDEVYLNGSKDISGSGTTQDDAVNNIEDALDLVAPYGAIYVTGNVVISNDLTMPNKIIFIKQQEGKDKGRLIFEKKLYMTMQLYIDGIEMEFTSTDKDCIFLNGTYCQITNTEIIGKPNIFIGSEDEDLDKEGQSGYLYFVNSKYSDKPLGNISLAGKDGHTILNGALTLGGVNVEGVISGENVIDKSSLRVFESTSMNKVKNLMQFVFYGNYSVYLKDSLENIQDLIAEGAIILKNGATLGNTQSINGKFTLDVHVPNGETLKEGTYSNSRAISADINLSDNLIKEGYKIHKITEGDSVKFDIIHKNTVTNDKPVIKGLNQLNIKQGVDADLKWWVTASDFEDGDLTDHIVFPNIKTSTLPVGKHELIYQVTDSDKNTVTMKRIINVLPNGSPIIHGLKDVIIKVGDVDKFDLLDGVYVEDDRDKNLKATTTDKIKKPAPGKTESTTITYTVTDSDNNTTTATRVITVTNELPTIDGLTDITIKKGQTAGLESGVTANDHEDGVLTDKIAFPSNNLSSLPVGSHKITYTVTDSDGNTTKMERLVVVEKDDEVVPPIEELENLLPNSIVEAITNNLLNLNSGIGTVDNPLEIEFNNISDDKVDSLLSDLNNLNTKINSLESKNGYTLVNLTILKDSNSKAFKTSDVSDLKGETHIVLKVKDEYTNIADKLRAFAKNNIEDSNDDNLNSDLDNNTNNDNINNDSINSDNQKPTGDNPKTGDYLSIGMLGSLASLSLLGLILNNFGRKKNKK